MVSIIIPVYNQADKFLKTLAGIAAQTYTDYEVIIVNDGSTDNVEKNFAEYSKTISTDNAYVFLNQENRGAPAARNYGFQASKGEYLLFCDADAVLKPEALEAMVNRLSLAGDFAFVYSDFYWGKKLFKPGDFDAERLKKMPYIHTMSLIRRSDFPNGGWDERIKKFQDWDLWLTMTSQGKAGLYIPKVLFTVSPGGTMSFWLPSFAYKLLPFLPAVRRYRAAMRIIKAKYSLP